MKFKLTITSILLLFTSVTLLAQRPPDEFFNGLKALSTDRVQAKKDMLATIAKMPGFHGAYHFLGIIYTEAQQQDSAIFYLDKAVTLNTENVNKTKEMSYARLIEAYTLKQDFEKAFQTGWEAYKLYPENRSITINFKDACLWSYYIKRTGLDSSYLSLDLKDEYEVTSIPQEYLITRKLMHNGERLNSQRVGHRRISKLDYDVFKWTAEDNTEKEFRFKLNWDMNTEFGGKTFPTDALIADKASPISERVGALLLRDAKVDLKTEIERLMK